jgi:hypothetical protein
VRGVHARRFGSEGRVMSPKPKTVTETIENKQGVHGRNMTAMHDDADRAQAAREVGCKHVPNDNDPLFCAKCEAILPRGRR